MQANAGWWASRFALVLTALGTACGGEPSLLVHILEWNVAAEYMAVVPWLDGSVRPSFKVPKDTSAFVVSLPEGRHGEVRLQLAMLDKEGCKIATSEVLKSLGPALRVTEEISVRLLPLDIKICRRPRMVKLPTGSFSMGSPENEIGRYQDEQQHEVTINTMFAMSETEVTRRQYAEIVGADPSMQPGSLEHPVESVSFIDAALYCNELSEAEGLQTCYSIHGSNVGWPEGLRCPGYRLPTESEWEFAARAGGTTRYAGADTYEQLKLVAWFADNSQESVQEVGLKPANAFGLRDMTGNVWEWVWDWYDVYSLSSQSDPTGPTWQDKTYPRVFRGGSFLTRTGPGDRLRVANRRSEVPTDRDHVKGFRIARSYP